MSEQRHSSFAAWTSAVRPRTLAAGAVPSLPTFNFLIEFSGKARRLDLASAAFMQLQAYHPPENVSYAAMIGVCAWLGQTTEAARLLYDMIQCRSLLPVLALLRPPLPLPLPLPPASSWPRQWLPPTLRQMLVGPATEVVLPARGNGRTNRRPSRRL